MNYNAPMGPMGGTGGPTLSGKFISIRDGSEVWVRDTMITDEGMMVYLRDGQCMHINEFNKEYYQMSDEEYDMNGNVIKSVTDKSAVEESPKPKLNESLIFDGLNAHDNVEPTEEKAAYWGRPDIVEDHLNQVPKYLSDEARMVQKLLEKVNGPKLNITIEWDDFPSKELNMLKTIYDVSDETIQTVMLNHYLDQPYLKEAVRQQLIGFLSEEKN